MEFKGSQTPLTSPENAFPYASLPATSTIRILTLHPGAPSEPLVGTLTHEILPTSQPYEAISYVWGSDTRCSALHLTDAQTGKSGTLPLTQSIHDALMRMRPHDESRRLWADQVCIDQDDITERGQQVKLMDVIYQSASHVLVWLGSDEHGNAQEAKDMIIHLDQVFRDETRHAAFKRKHSLELGHRDAARWVPLSKLTQQPWFTRIWIVQEIGTSTPSTLHWGPHVTISWALLSRVADVLNTSYHLLRTRFSIFTPNIRYLDARFVEPDTPYGEDYNRGSFIYELHRARHLRTKDPRDHVYAFLGHFSRKVGTEGLRAIEVDYSRTIDHVFTDVARRGLEGAKTLIVLSAVHGVLARNRTNRSRRKPLNVPSWVPDWRVLPLHLIGSPECPHLAAGNTLPSLEIDGRVLKIKGRTVDVVARAWWTFFGQAFQIRDDAEALKDRKDPFEILWKDLTGKDMLDTEEQYLTGESKLFALMQTLANGCVGINRTKGIVTLEENLAHVAAYLIKAGLGAKMSQQLVEMAAGGDPYRWSHEATLVTRYRRVGLTEKGYYLLAPDTLRQGDEIVILDGGKTPFVLRPGQDATYELGGECYVHGLMNGEGTGADKVIFSIV
ncbi:Heterokaryon incompatibility protein 6 [Emericellopsis cladophorae]|uniref:Heterokaryon incompatibility protein 6 n=1 Tax=Emericellopsis cladophorae TaxID=2686198 RepID=A0A9P9XZR8_9HYPO|nr:Heterokaryon incompatibility protein 6 [Emericellopsis cladophorae]KAI6780866.1 Heterokaryon incompatibility protein 6 [Emericellopsis cladophorae]